MSATESARRAERWTVLLTGCGSHVAADTVVAGGDVWTTSELAGSPECIYRARRTVRVGNGIGMVVRLATNDLPRYPPAPRETSRPIRLTAPRRAVPRSREDVQGSGH